MTRRGLALGLSAFACESWAVPAAPGALAALERRHGGRLGVFALDTGSGRALAQRADERFLLCSTFKMLLAAAVLARVDAGQERLDRRVRYGQADLFDYAPVAKAHVREGSLTVEALCSAAVQTSDNTAANLLLASIGGPAGVTGFVHGIGDSATRLDRIELALNRPDGEKDTTTPRAMAHSAARVLLGDVLKPRSRSRLEAWMAASTPGLNRLRAGIPPTWQAGDKSGTSDTRTNDVAILRPLGRAPLIVAAYYEGSAVDEKVLAEAGTIVAAWSAAQE